MGREIPKQFLEIGGKAILIHTVERFLQVTPLLDTIILVLPKTDIPYWNELTKALNFGGRVTSCRRRKRTL